VKNAGFQEKGATKTARERSNPDSEQGFLFLGNQLALDLLNTRPVIDGEPVELIPDFGSLLRWFQAAGLVTPEQSAVLRGQGKEPQRARRLLSQILELREMLRREVISLEDGKLLHRATIGELNRLMREHPMRRTLAGSGASIRVEDSIVCDRLEDLVAPLAEAAARLFAECDRSRIRKCDQCVLHFLDTSKKGTRRWCSMSLCGNRAKVAAYAQRNKAGNE
jgi:predicted RNA-binding Zn ribbon-like protein